MILSVTAESKNSYGGKKMIPLHEVDDPKYVQQLAACMECDGWQGAPLVMWKVYGDLITGTHRYAAARSIGWQDCDIPMIDIRDVFAEAGLDFDEVLAEYDNPYLTEPSFLNVLNELPDEIREKYGIDMH